MTDRELLEAAAKAAGIDWNPDTSYRTTGRIGATGMPHMAFWNPLSDDGDALRLAVKLDLIDERKWKAPVTGAIYDECNGDWYSATRRAIVMAAAEIGAQTKGETA